MNSMRLFHFRRFFVIIINAFLFRKVLNACGFVLKIHLQIELKWFYSLPIMSVPDRIS